MENKYQTQFPLLMEGKKIMYVHGFGSSAQSGTVKLLRQLMPNATVVAKDLPIHPEEAMDDHKYALVKVYLNSLKI